MANKNQEYAEKYAAYAMEQMRLYGIPASVTLAQGILESANGQSQLARNENNHFGIKAGRSWLESGGRYGLYTDDRPDEKFCSYDSVADSYTHHSRVLKNNSRYTACFSLAPDDYRGWAQGLDRAGYATAGSYAPSLISIIERNNLQEYDRQVIEQMRSEELVPGQGLSDGIGNNMSSAGYSFPLQRDEFMLATSPFGMRDDPVNPGHEQMHKGIDIRCDNEPLLATEGNGKVVAVNENAGTAGGKSVTVEYERGDGTKLQVYLAHLSSVNVKTGDTVNAGQQLGVTGNTGTRTTGPHLHFGVRQISTDGSARDMDPAAYLADIARKGNITQTVMHNGADLLAAYRPDDSESVETENNIDTSMSPDDWMKKLLSSEDSGVGLAGTGHDPVMDMVITLFTSLMALAVKIDSKSEEDAMQVATDAAIERRIDLFSLVPRLRECSLTVRENDIPVLQYDDGTGSRSCRLSLQNVNRLSVLLNDSSIPDSQKEQRVAAMVNGIVLNDNMSRNYNQGMSAQSVSETITR